MAEASLVELLTQHGAWGVVALLAGVVGVLFRALQRANESRCQEANKRADIAMRLLLPNKSRARRLSSRSGQES